MLAGGFSCRFFIFFLQRSGLDERAEGELAGSPAELIGSEIRRTREAQAHLFI